jgi:hypothetical protein
MYGMSKMQEQLFDDVQDVGFVVRAHVYKIDPQQGCTPSR